MEFLQEHLGRLLGMGGLLCLSAFFSGSETALFNLSKVHLRRRRRSGKAASRAAVFLAARPAEFLATVLLCNMSVNILFFSLSAGLSAKIARIAGGETLGHGAMVLLSLGMLLLVIVFGEVTPKNLAVLAPVGFIRTAALPMLALHVMLAPLRRLLRKLTRIAELLSSSPAEGRQHLLEEFRIMLDALAEEGVLSRADTATVSEVMDLPDVKVREFMTPRVEMIMARRDMAPSEVVALARSSGCSKLPVYAENRDRVVGVVDAREIFLAGDAARDLAGFLHPPVYISAYQRADSALKFLQDHRVQLAIVVDEYGGTAGLLTRSDVLSEIFAAGTSDETPPVRALGTNRYAVTGALSLREWRNLFPFEKSLPRVDTVAGLVAAKLGRLPQAGDVVRAGRIRITVETVVRRRAVGVIIDVLPEDGEGAA